MRKPKALKAGAVLGVAAPGGPVDRDRLEAGEAIFREAGFEIFHRPDLFARDGYLAGDDAHRAAEFMELVRDSRVEGIICARGGYGCGRILPALDADAVRAAAKPVVGYSDITALLLWQQRCAGLIGFHGPMLDRGADIDPLAIDHLVAQLTGSARLPVVLQGKGAGGGQATGPLVGGSLTLVTASIGSPWEIDTEGAILLLEDVAEAPYRIDRMLQQLHAAGKLERVAGIGIGSFGRCSDPQYPDPSVDAVIEAVMRPLGVPFVIGLPFGHARANFAWPMGVRATLDGTSGELRLLEQGVSGA